MNAVRAGIVAVLLAWTGSAWAQTEPPSAVEAPTTVGDTATPWVLPELTAHESVRRFTVRASVFSGHWDLLSASFSWHPLEVAELEFGFWANPLWKGRGADSNVAGGVEPSGLFFRGIATIPSFDRRRIDGTGWQGFVPFLVGFRTFGWSQEWALLLEIGLGYEAVTWVRPGLGVAMSFTGSIPFFELRNVVLPNKAYPIFRLSVGVSF